MFNPLGNFQADAAINPAVLAVAQAYRDTLKTKYPCPAGTLKRIYGHWTVGHLGVDYPDYNGAVRYDGTHYHLDVPGNPQDNAIGVNNNTPHYHTYMRNTGAFGIATDDMVFATEHDFGSESLTLMALEFLCGGIAAVGSAYSIDLTGMSTDAPYANEPNFLTHGAAANLPGNPAQYANYYVTGERWDLSTFVPLPAGMTNKDIDPMICSNALAHRAHLYKLAFGN